MNQQRTESAAPVKWVKVWDPLVRVGHWSLVIVIAIAWFTREGGHVWHERFGYAALAIVALRIVWGFIGPRFARFSQFVRTPAATLDYAGQVLRLSEPRHLGHNPLGGWMILALLLNVLLVGASGWLYTTDAYWGVKWVEEVHEFFADSLLVLAALHVAGVVFASWRHHENLAAAMLSGCKRPPGPGDVN